MSTTTKLMSAQDFFDLPERTGSQVLELIDGELVVSPSPIMRHAHAANQLAYHLTNHVRRTGGGVIAPAVDVVFGSSTVLCPDLAYTRKERFKLSERGYPDAIPDLCVEVLSPTSVKHDRQTKLRLYADAGVPCYWVIDPEQFVFECFELRDGVYLRTRLAKQDEQVSAPPLDDLVIPLGDLWFRLN